MNPKNAGRARHASYYHDRWLLLLTTLVADSADQSMLD